MNKLPVAATVHERVGFYRGAVIHYSPGLQPWAIRVKCVP